MGKGGTNALAERAKGTLPDEGKLFDFHKAGKFYLLALSNLAILTILEESFVFLLCVDKGILEEIGVCGA